MSRLRTLLAIAYFALPGGAPALAQAAETTDPVVQWNQTLLKIVRTHGAQPATVHPTRSFAIMHAAIYDAVNSIDGTHQPYLVRLERLAKQASQEAAAAAAAHEVLLQLYPAFQSMIDAQLAQSLALLADGVEKTEGIDIGVAAAEAVLSLRNDDGSSAQPIPYIFGSGAGAYQSTPPNFPPQPVFTHWSRVTTFALRQASQFRPDPPPALMSVEYTQAFNEVKSVGVAGSITATVDQALTGRFWNGAIQNYWNEIAQTAAVSHELTTAQSARLFALLNLALADSVIAFYDAKYTYNFWRPVTAIRNATLAANPHTTADPNWLPEVTNTAADPSYPGAHAVISAAAASVLQSVFGHKPFRFAVTSEVLPGVQRSFDDFAAAAEEASLSRVFAGVHFRTDEAAGEKLGRSIAGLVVEDLLRARD